MQTGFITRFTRQIVRLGVAIILPASAAAGETAPDFGPNVRIFDPTMPPSAIQQQVDSIFATQEAGQFNANRYALLFKPGRYQLDVQVGFYTQVQGLACSSNYDALSLKVTLGASAPCRRCQKFGYADMPLWALPSLCPTAGPERQRTSGPFS